MRQTKYMESDFIKARIRNEWIVKMDYQKILLIDHFCYHSLIIYKAGEIKENVVIKTEGVNEAKRCFWSCSMEDNVGQPTNKTLIEWRPSDENVRWRSGKARKDRIKKECIHGNLGVAPIGDKMRYRQLKWFGLVMCIQWLNQLEGVRWYKWNLFSWKSNAKIDFG